MVTSTFGKIFLEAYNEKYGTQYDAKSFFVEKYWPLFFNHNKYMMWAQNSPFVQMKAGQKVETLTDIERNDKLEEFIAKVESGAADASVALGYAASEEKEYATTSGQVTGIPLEKDVADIYLSWIGASLALGVAGGMTILFNNKNILLDIFEGWEVYRSVLTRIEQMKGNQISSWNGVWLAHRYGRSYNPRNPMDNFNSFTTKGEEMSVELNSWTKILSGIARKYGQSRMLGYVYKFDKTNTTIGFIPFSLNHIRHTAELYRQLFGYEEYRQAEELFGTAEGLKKSCQLGAIGIKALEPKGLAEYVKKGIVPKNKEIEKKQINFHTYIIWILAMLNNQELWDKAQTFASALKAFSESGEKGRRDRVNLTNEVLSSTNKRIFIENLSEVVAFVDDKVAIIETAKLVNEMPTDNVPYFLTLIRFQYATIK